MKISNSKMIVFICLAMLSLNSIARTATPTKSDFVLLIYMNGSNLESEYKLATHNIEEMAKGKFANVSDVHLLSI